MYRYIYLYINVMLCLFLNISLNNDTVLVVNVYIQCLLEAPN